jgi:hypothetical protein
MTRTGGYGWSATHSDFFDGGEQLLDIHVRQDGPGLIFLQGSEKVLSRR